MGISIPAAWNLQQTAAQKQTVIPTVLTQEGARFQAAENMAVYQFTPYDLIPSSDGIARLTIDIVGSVAAGAILGLTNSYFNLLLTASLTPTFNEFWTTAAPTSVSNRQLVAEAIANELSNSNMFSNYYNVWSVGNQIFIEAKVSGVQLTLLPSTIPVGMNVSSYAFGQDKYAPSQFIDYSLFVSVYVSEGAYGDLIDRSQATLVDTLYFPFNNETQQLVNINGLIKDYVDKVLPTKITSPGWNLTSLDANQESPVSRPFFIVYGDAFRYVRNGDKKLRVQGMSNMNFVINAGFNKLNPYALLDNVLSVNSSQQFYFMTSTPPNKEVTYTSHEYLAWYQRRLNLSGFFGYTIDYKFYDGTSVTVDSDAQLHAGVKGIVNIDVSPNVINILGVEAANGKLVDEYSIRIWWTPSDVSSSIFYSFPQSYKMHRKCNELSNNVIFLNEYGVWDSIEFRGEVDTSLDRDYSLINRALPFNANTTAAISTEVNLTHRITANTAYSLYTLLDSTHYEWAKKLIESSSVYIFDTVLQQYRHIVITDYSYNHNTKGEEFELQITFNYTTSNNTITR